MEFPFTPSPELMQKASLARTPEELQALAKENGMDITPEQAQEYFDRLHKTGELEDDELENVAGGICTDYNRYFNLTNVSIWNTACPLFVCAYCGMTDRRITAFGFYDRDHKCKYLDTGIGCGWCKYKKNHDGKVYCTHPDKYNY